MPRSASSLTPRCGTPRRPKTVSRSAWQSQANFLGRIFLEGGGVVSHLGGERGEPGVHAVADGQFFLWINVEVEEPRGGGGVLHGRHVNVHESALRQDDLHVLLVFAQAHRHDRIVARVAEHGEAVLNQFAASLERADRIGGLLRYGIPDFKLEKSVLDRRLDLMRQEGIQFETGVRVGVDVTPRELGHFDALVICTGADLEASWLPLLLRKANNRDVLPGQPGFLAASEFVTLLEKPQVLDRAAGDIHPFGNPHIQMDPRNIGLVAAELGKRLQVLDSANAEAYAARSADFQGRWNSAVQDWATRLEALQGARLVTYHRSWVYLFTWAGLVEAGTLEPKPGVPPSSSYLSELLATLKGQEILGIVHASYQDSRPSEWLSERTGIPVPSLPHTVGSTPQVTDLFSMFEVLVSTLEGAAK